MKKLVALLVALTMVLSVTAVFAVNESYDWVKDMSWSELKEELAYAQEGTEWYAAYQAALAAQLEVLSPSTDDQTGTTEETTETTTTTYVVTAVTEEETLSFKKLDTMTEAATALLNDPTKLGLAEGKVAQEIMSVEIDTENNNLIKVTGDMTVATGIEVIVALTSEDSADATFDFIKATSVEVTADGALKPTYPAGTMDAATAAATITLIVVTDAME